MGKGDKKTRRGKLFMGSYGNTRPKKTSVKIEKPEIVKKPIAKAKSKAKEKK